MGTVPSLALARPAPAPAPLGAAGALLVTALWDRATASQRDLPEPRVCCAPWLSGLAPCHRVTSTSTAFPPWKLR